MNWYAISNYTRPEAGHVTIQGNDERDAVIRLLRLTGDSRGICEVIPRERKDQWHVLIQNGWTLIVNEIDPPE